MKTISDYSCRLPFLVGLIVIVASTGCSNPSIRDLSFLRGSEKSSIASIETETNPVDLTIWHDSFETAQRLSQQTGKPILADFTGSDWCSWCKKLEKDVFETAEFKEWAHDNVILLELDYPRTSIQPAAIVVQNRQLKEKYNISGYPTVLLLSPDGDVMGKMGYKKAPREWIASAEGQLEGQLVNHQTR